MNIYEKLIKARAQFLEVGVQKTGKNYGIGYKYFELKDIVPVATKIFNELGMVAVVTFDEVRAQMNVYNTEKPEEFISFESPMRYAPTSRGSNDVQSLGGTHTYLRRYLYMNVLDIIEEDAIESGVEVLPIENITPKAEQREEMKKELTDTDGKADKLQINAINIACKKYLDITNKSEEAKAFVAKIVQETNNLADVSKAKAEEIIKELNNRVNSKTEQPLEISTADLPF